MLLRNTRGLRRTRGASRQGASAAPGDWPRRLMPWLFIGLLLMVGDLAWRAFRDVANVPIREVNVNGDFRFIDTTRIEQLITPHLGTGYFLVDLQQIRAELERLPLVYEVTVRRAWPDRLWVFLTEQVPVLKFGEDAYLNPYGEAFTPERALTVSLPRVDGPAGSEAKLLSTFDRFAGELESTGLQIQRLRLDGKHAWVIELSNGTEVLLGRRDIDDKVRTLVHILNGHLQAQRNQIARIDMRYSNGIAVAYREPDDANPIAKGTQS